MSTRILIVTQWFDPEPTFKGIVFARELVKQGFEVEVLTGFPNYPGGKLYPGYKIKMFQREELDGVAIRRVPLYPSHDQSALGRIFNYVSFAASSLVCGLFFLKRPDVIYAYHPPLTVGICAAVISFFRRVPMVYDIQDLWPDTLRATGMLSNPAALNLISKICNWVYRRADQLVVLSPGFKSILVERGVPKDKIEVIYNWCDEEALKEKNENLVKDFPVNDKFRILFAGNIGKAQALDAVLVAADLLEKRGIKDLEFVLLGNGIELENLKKQAAKLGLTSVQFLPPVPMKEVGAMLRSADALLVHLRKDPLFEITIPSKTQAYMAVGKPILMAVAGDAAQLIRASECGAIAESENSESIVEAALTLRDSSSDRLLEMAERSKNYYRKHLSLQVGVARFTDTFNRIIDRR